MAVSAIAARLRAHTRAACSSSSTSLIKLSGSPKSFDHGALTRFAVLPPELKTSSCREASYNVCVTESQAIAKKKSNRRTSKSDGNRSVIQTSAMFRALRHRNFQLFFSGQLISLVGTWMQNVAQAWLVYRMTGSSLLLGVVSFAGQIPVFPLAPLAGMVADRLNRRKVVIATQTASMILALVLAFLTLTNRVTVWEVIVLAALMGVVNLSLIHI